MYFIKKHVFFGGLTNITGALDVLVGKHTIRYDTIRVGTNLIHDFTDVTFSVKFAFFCLQCFDAVGWAAGRASGLQKKLECSGTGMVIYLERGADLHMAQLMPLPLTVSCYSKIQIGFTFLVPAHPGSPGKGAVKRV